MKPIKLKPEVEDGEAIIRAMFSVDGAGVALQRSGFDLEEELTAYIDIARNSLEDGSRLTALTRLGKRLREIAEINGMISTGSVRMVSHDEDGTRIEQTRSESRILSAVRGTPSFGGATAWKSGSRVLESRIIPPTDSAPVSPNHPIVEGCGPEGPSTL